MCNMKTIKQIPAKYFRTFMTMMLFVTSLSCSDDSSPSNVDRKIESFSVTSPVQVTGTINESDHAINATLPFGTDLTSVKVDVTTNDGTTVIPKSGSTVDFSKGPVPYVVSAAGKNVVYKVTVVTEGPTKVAFIGLADDVSSITEPDTKAAATWTQSTYGDDFVYLKIADITPEKLADVKVIFWYFDDTGVDRNSIIPEDAKNEIVLGAINSWYQSGGNLLLAGYGTQYLPVLGRITADYAPVIYGNGVGGNNPDNWGINAGTGLTADRTSHPIYTGLTTSQIANPETGGTYGHDFFPTIGPGYKEDHNSMWDLNAIAPLNGSGTKGALFETNTKSLILGTWQHVTDLCCAAVVEFQANDSYDGTSIAIGTSSYEWEMNDDRTNEFESNVEKLTKNSIDYLKSK
jgi:hypothetical protein